MTIVERHVLVLSGPRSLGWSLAQRCLDVGARVTLAGAELDDLNRALLARPELNSAALDPRDEQSLGALLRSLPSVHAIAITLGSAGHPEQDDVVWPGLGSLRRLVLRAHCHLPNTTPVLLTHGVRPRSAAENGLEDTRSATIRLSRTLATDVQPRCINVLAYPDCVRPIAPTREPTASPAQDVARVATSMLAMRILSGVVLEIDPVLSSIKDA